MNERIEAQIEKYQERILLLKKYVLMKFNEGDMHGVCDAGMDIRDNEAAIKALNEWREN